MVDELCQFIELCAVGRFDLFFDFILEQLHPGRVGKL